MFLFPSVKLSVSIPYSAGCLPVCYNNIDEYKAYVNADETILYPFGFGLSYSEFVYKNVQIKKVDGFEFHITVDITNKSDTDGFETAMVFIRKNGGLVRKRRRELKAFKKLFIKARSTVSASIVLN